MIWFAAPSPTERGLWCCARRGAGVETVEVDGFNTRDDAGRHARELTNRYEREQARRAHEPDRFRIPAGFYTNEDAA